MSTPGNDGQLGKPPAWLIEFMQERPFDPRPYIEAGRRYRLQLEQQVLEFLIDPSHPPVEPTRPADPVDFHAYQANLLREIAEGLAIPAEYFTAADSTNAAANRAK